MNFRRIIDSLVEPLKQTKSKAGGKKTNTEHLPFDIYGPRIVHTEEYKTALQVAEEFRQLEEYEDRIAFWDAHFSVFGPAPMIVFDAEKETYWPYYDKTQNDLYDDLSGDEKRYKMFTILPDGVDEFWSFVDWCVDKCPSVEHIFKIMDEDYYWKRIKHNLIPEDFLTDLLNVSESHRNHANKLPSHWGSELITDEMAGKYFFYYGNQDATDGDPSMSLQPTFDLFAILNKMTTRALSDYGRIFFQYYDGHHTALMVAFLREQKRRLDRGEDITVPSATLDNKPNIDNTQLDDNTLVNVDSQKSRVSDLQNEPLSELTFVFIKEKKRATIVRQLGLHLNDINKARLESLLHLKKPDNKIEITIDVKVLADYFRQVYQSGDINNNDYKKEELGEWLAFWFIKPNGKKYRPESFKDYLHMTDSNAKVKAIKQRIIYSKV